MHRMFTWANFLTFLRLVSVPLILITLQEKQYEVSLMLFLFASVSDALDGFVARHFNQESKLGKILDPLADKALMLVLFYSMARLGKIEGWIFSLVLLRDIQIMSGILYLKMHKIPFHYQPITLSKINTTVQAALMLVLLIHLSTYCPLDSLILTLKSGLVITNLLSGWFYYKIFITLKRKGKSHD